MTFDSGDHAYWVGGPDEVFGIDVVSATKRLMGTCRSMTDRNTPRLRRWRVRLAKKPSTALSQDAEVGVKWNIQRMLRKPWRGRAGANMGLIRLLAALIVGGAHAIDDIQQ